MDLSYSEQLLRVVFSTFFSLKCYLFLGGCPPGSTDCNDGIWCVFNEFVCDFICDCPINCSDEDNCGRDTNMTLPNRPVTEDPKFIIHKN